MSLSSKLVLASALALGAAPAVATAAPVAHQVQVVKSSAKAPASSDATDYANRESKDKQVADFQGGNVVVIGISGGALIVLLFLLLLI